MTKSRRLQSFLLRVRNSRVRGEVCCMRDLEHVVAFQELQYITSTDEKTGYCGGEDA